MFEDGKRQESTQEGRQQGMQITIEQTTDQTDCTSDVGVTSKKMRSGLHDLNPVVPKTYMSNVEAFCREPEMREVCMDLTIIVPKLDNTGYPVM